MEPALATSLDFASLDEIDPSLGAQLQDLLGRCRNRSFAAGLLNSLLCCIFSGRIQIVF